MRTLFIFIAFLFCSGIYGQPITDFYAEGMAAKSAEKYELALANFKKATEQKPANGDAWYELGWCHNELQQFEDALVALNKAKTYLKNSPKVFYESGYANDYLDKTEDALKDFKKCIELDPSFAPAYRDMANIYFDIEKDYKLALENYNATVKNANEEQIGSKIWYRKGYCENDLELYDDALESLKKSVALDSAYGPAVKELGFAYYGIKKYNEALLYLQKSLKLEESNAAYYYTGLCYIALKQKNKASEIYNKLVEVKSPDAPSFLELLNAMK